jgi:hypothetical protein
MLQTMRLRAEVPQHVAAAVINRKQVRISQIENGKGALKPSELALLLDFYGATEQERETATGLGLETRRRQNRRAYTDVLPDAFQRLADLQASAAEIRHYEFGVIPGPLQSKDYVRGIVQIADGIWWKASPEQVESRIAFRLDQQHRVLGAQRKGLSFVFTEDALHNRIGEPALMEGQVIHLLNLIESRPELGIQIIPAGAPDNPALGGGLIVMDFDAAPRIGYVAALYGPTTYYDHVDDTEPMLLVFNRVRELALSPADSRALLIKALKGGHG